MKRVIKWIVILGVIGAAVAGIGYSVKMGNIVEVELVSPTRGDLTSYVEETGRIRLDRWHVVTARVAGVCDAVRVDVGDAVREGQVIAEIDDTAYVEGVRQARASILEIQARIDGLRVQLPRDAEVRQAALQTEIARKNLKMETVRGQTLRARLEQTEKDLERFQNLSAEGSYPLAEVDRVKTELATLKDSLTNHANLLKVAQLNVDVALQVQKLLEDRKGDVDHLKKALEAQMAQIQSQIAVLENDRKKAVIAAPFAGVVLERMTKGDTFVQPGTPVIRVGDPASVEVEVDLLTDDLPLIGLGRTSFVSGKALGDVTYEGKVVKIYPEAFTKISRASSASSRLMA